MHRVALFVSVVALFLGKNVGMAAPNSADKPNIVFIAVDDLRPELSCYGRAHIHSPNIDRLAASGVLFEHAYCMVPTCGASRASLMTGIRPARNRFKTYLTRADEDAPEVTTLNTHLKNNGYYTVSLGKVFHNPKDSQTGWSEPAWRAGRSGYQLLENQKLHRRNQAKGKKRGPAWESADAPDHAYADGKIALQAVQQLKKLKQKGEPFFLAVGFLKPHLPFVAPEKYWRLYDPSEIRLPDNYHPPKDAPKESLHNSGELRSYAGIPARGKVSDQTAHKLIHGYYACVSITDAQVGRVLDALDKLELADNTIVVLWGDHGWNLGDHQLWCKHSCYESSMHIPLIVRDPRIKAGQRRSALVETIDLYPTLCDLVGVAAPKHLQGESLRALLTDADAAWKDWAVGRFGNGDTIRTPKYRYSEYTSQRGEVKAQMLYDHNSDPGEDTNVGPNSPEELDRLSKRLNQLKGK